MSHVFIIILILTRYFDMIFPLQVAEKGFRRLTPDQSVGLKYAGMVIKLHKVVKVRQDWKSLSTAHQGCEAWSS